jgi:SP family general alpha glucoside:H+ symporter-like MFS transporter
VIVKCIQLSAQVLSWYNIERFGRRILLLIGGGGMTVFCLSIAAVGTPNWVPPGGLTIALFCLWTFCYASSCALIGYVYLAEIATPRLRAKTAGFAAACTACFGIFTNFVTPILLSVQKAGWSYKTGESTSLSPREPRLTTRIPLFRLRGCRLDCHVLYGSRSSGQSSWLQHQASAHLL